MLDVHPPHHPLHAWRDFFIHLATISIGLLIALGLEAGVEWLHHRHQVEHVREELRHEMEENSKKFAENTGYFRRDAAGLENNLLVLNYLQKHPHAQARDLPGVIILDLSYATLDDAAWKAAQQTGVLALMPQEEVKHNAVLYEYVELVNTTNLEEFHVLFQSMGSQFLDPDPMHMSPEEVTESTRLARESLAIHLRKGFLMHNLAQAFPALGAAPSQEELVRILHFRELEANPDFKNAFALTDKRIAQASTPAPAGNAAHP